MTDEQHEHLDRVRERFTRTAEAFARFALTTRGEEAERLIALVAPRRDELALDVACGPGTFTRVLAPRVRFVLGLDLTPAMLAEARQASPRERFGNIVFACGDANALPFADGAVDLGVCGYSVHHFLDPARTIKELSRVVRRGGRVGLADLVVPEGAHPEWTNRIERARDASHATTLTISQLSDLLEAAGLRVIDSQLGERVRRFDEWMQTVGAPPGTATYRETRRLMEDSVPGDLAGFHPRLTTSGPTPGELVFVQTTAFVAAKKS